MTKQLYDSGRITAAKQDGSREFISLLASICADGTTLPPALIYKGASGDLQDTWMEDLGEKEQAFFASSTNGWSSNAFGLAYLKQVFDPSTRAKAGRKRRLLIVDGHSSHVNMEFIRTCDRLKILLIILPPHSTHRLQPLDVGCFLPLSTCYSIELNKVIEKSAGLVSFTKRMFWPTFKAAWDKSMTEENILSAFAKTGIWPYKPQIILSVIGPSQPETPPKASSNMIATPYTSRRMRQFAKTYTKNPTKEAFRKLTKANEANSALASIAEHRAKGLKEALQMEKKKRRRGKKLDLSGEPSGKAQFFGVEEVIAAQAFENAKLEKIEQEKLDKEKKKEDKKIEKTVKEALQKQEKAKKAKQKVEKKRELLNKAAGKKIAAAARKVAAETKKTEKKTIPTRIVILRVGPLVLSNIESQEEVVADEPIAEAVGVVQTSRSGRPIVLPQRLKK
jgi:DDE superfamily endonuclease